MKQILLILLFLNLDFFFSHQKGVSYMLASAYNDYIYLSYDNGVTWNSTGALDNWVDAECSTNGKYVVACNKVFSGSTLIGAPMNKSSNFGASFTSGSGSSTIFEYYCSTSSDGNLFLYGASEYTTESLGYTFDYGQTLNYYSYSGGNYNCGSVFAFPNGNGFVAKIGTGITSSDHYIAIVYNRSTNTFTSAMQLPVFPSRSWSICSTLNGDYIYILTADGSRNELYFSSNYGSSWSVFHTGISSYAKKITCSGDGKYMVVSGRDSGGYLFAQYSSDYGSSWSSSTLNVSVFKDPADLKMSKSGKYVLLAGDGTKLYLSSDYGATFIANTTLSNKNWTSVDIK